MTTIAKKSNLENKNAKSNATSAKKTAAPKASKKVAAKAKERTAEEVAAAKTEVRNLFAGITLPKCVSTQYDAVVNKLAEIDENKGAAKNQTKVISGANALSKLIHGELELHCRTMMGDAFIRSLWVYLLKKANIKAASKLKNGADLAALVGDNMRDEDGSIKMPALKPNPRYWVEEKKTTKLVDGKKVVSVDKISHGGEEKIIKKQVVKTWNDVTVILAVLLSQKAEGIHTSIEKYEELKKDASLLAQHKATINDNTALIDAFNVLTAAEHKLNSKTEAYNKAVKEKKADATVAKALSERTSAQDAYEKAKADYDKLVAKADKAEAAAKKAEAANKKNTEK